MQRSTLGRARIALLTTLVTTAGCVAANEVPRGEAVSEHAAALIDEPVALELPIDESVAPEPWVSPYSAPSDFDGDGKTDLALWRPSGGLRVFQSEDQLLSSTPTPWAQLGDLPVPGDYDGDGRADLALFRRSNATWYIEPSGGGPALSFQFGSPGDTPVPGDRDGDGKSDAMVWHRANADNPVCFWATHISGSDAVELVMFGHPNDIPAAGDYDGDGKTDLAVWSHAGIFTVRFSSNEDEIEVPFPIAGDLAVPGDYDGDGKTDLAVWDRSGEWTLRPSSGDGHFVTINPFGAVPGAPAPGDYDGDGKIDFAMWNRETHSFRINDAEGDRALKGIGSACDQPVNDAILRIMASPDRDIRGVTGCDAC
jgi:hypothetical protein